MWEQIRANRRRSILLILTMAFLLLGLGYGIGHLLDPLNPWLGTAIAGGIWLILWLAAVSVGSDLVLASAGAQEIKHADLPVLHNVVEEMTIAAALPKRPRVFLIDCSAPNAFACGTPANSAVAVTTGLLTKLNRDELQGVIAHEIGHIKNQDTKFMTLAGIMMGAIVLLADGLMRVLWFGGGRRRSSRSSGGGQAQIIIMLVVIFFAILAPILAQLLYFACSRKREYLADASAARFTRYPEGLARALEKIAGPARAVKHANRVTAPMYIINPLKGGEGANPFSTHPPTAARVRILRAMAGGAGLGDYESAFRKTTGQGVLGAHTLAQADGSNLRTPAAESPADTELGRAREAVDVLHRSGGYLFLACACGLKMKIPPSHKGDTINCPRCGRTQTIPVAAVAAAAALAADENEEQQTRKKKTPPQSYRFTPGQWQSFRCTCGNTVQLSPNFSANRTRCRKCGRTTRIIRG